MNTDNRIRSMSQYIEQFDVSRLIYRLDIGSPQFTLAEVLGSGVEDLKNVLLDYGPSNGLCILRELLAQKVMTENNLDVTASNVTVTSGATAGLYAVLSVILSIGDAVLVPLPAWPSYANYVYSLHGRVVHCPLEHKTGGLVLSEEILNYYHHKFNIKAVIITTPHNPTGRIFAQEDLQEVIECCIKRNVYVIIDEAYHGLTYSHYCHDGYVRHQNVFYVRSFSKYYLLPGIRLGYVFGDAQSVSQVGSVHNAIHGKTSILSQHIGVKLLLQDDTVFQQQVQKYRNNLNFFRQLLYCNMQLLEMIEPDGAFFILCKIKQKIDMDSFLNRLANVYRTMVIPGSVFSADLADYIRISLTEKEARIYKGFENLVTCIGDCIE